MSRRVICQVFVFGLAIGALSACSRDAPTETAKPRDTVVSRIGSSSAKPDEFKVLTQKPLVVPEDLTSLPEPGGSNRADLTPRVDALAALGGVQGLGAPVASDAALIAAARGKGVDANIRATLAAEDVEYRANNRGRFLERLAGRANDAVVYKDMLLEASPEVLRLQRLGIRTPATPSEPTN